MEPCMSLGGIQGFYMKDEEAGEQGCRHMSGQMDGL